MKVLKLFTVVIILSSCSPRLHYLGETYAPTIDVEVYYSPDDIEKEFKVMGQLNGNNSNNSFVDLENIQEAMIDQAKQRGADAILFLYSDIYDEYKNVRADLLIYKD